MKINGYKYSFRELETDYLNLYCCQSKINCCILTSLKIVVIDICHIRNIHEQNKLFLAIHMSQQKHTNNS